ncbi:hypothetical protein WMF18_36150 [Sorangium sp. So ce315]|uniref:hypothetical protein n=1 Tax=Sorangium sp. So ce315 TaxID=3133299 RepID=UPI003F63B20A
MADTAAPDAASPDSMKRPQSAARAAEKRANGSGSVRLRGKTWTARLSLGEAGRRTFSLPTCRTEHEANARLEVLAELSGRLIAAGQVVLGVPLLEQGWGRGAGNLKVAHASCDFGPGRPRE